MTAASSMSELAQGIFKDLCAPPYEGEVGNTLQHVVYELVEAGTIEMVIETDDGSGPVSTRHVGRVRARPGNKGQKLTLLEHAMLPA